MAGKASKSGYTEPEPSATEPPSTAAPDLSSGNADPALKAEDIEALANEAHATPPQPETVASTATKPSAADAAQDDSVSRGSSESDDKAVTSPPSKKVNGRFKKGSKNSRGKLASSKRSSEENDTNGHDDAAAADASEEAHQPPGITDATTEANESDVPSVINQSAEVMEADGLQAADAEPSTDSVDSSAQAKSITTIKELSQLGLSSFGDGAEDDIVGPRRSRRGPGISPDPKARVLKTEPDLDANTLQRETTPAGDDAAEDAALAAQGDAIHATPLEQDTKAEVEDPIALKEVATEAQTDGELEFEDERQNASADEAKPESKILTASNEDDGEGIDANYANADDHDGDLGGEEAGDEGVTRCVCGSADENVGLMIQCETCKCWQHCVCMGMQVEEDCPDVYYCEQCRPELHIPLLRSLGLLPKASKKGTGKGGTKYSARELKEAKEAIALLAQENARRQQAAEAAVAFSSRDRKASHHTRSDASKEVPKSPKRRSTMNSRDSAYGGWEPIPPGLLADGEVWDGVDDKKGGKKRKRGLPEDHLDSAAGTPEAGEGAADATSASDASKRRRVSAGAALDQDGDAEMDEDEMSGAVDHTVAVSRDKSSKKKKGNNQYTVREASVAHDASASKPRHPNQYTYRNKDRNGAATGAPNGQKTGSSSTSNLTSHSPSPSPSKGRAEHARRAAARDAGSQVGTPAPGESGYAGRSGHGTAATQWSLPEHLTHLAYLLPQAGGSRQDSSRSSGPAGESGLANGSTSASKKGSVSASGQTSSVPSPPAGASFPTPFQVFSSIESSTKVRFPSRRMTMGEMRKRVRNIGEYVTRSQIEAVEREKRMKLLGIVPVYMDETDEDAEDGAEAMHRDVKNADAVNAGGMTTEQHANLMDGNAEATKAEAQARLAKLPLSMRLMEELTRELIHFQRKFGVGPGSYGSLGVSHQSTTVI